MTFRPGRPDDAAEVARVFALSRAAGLPYLPTLHTPDEDRAFFGGELRTRSSVVAESDGHIVGFVIFDDSWVHHLYVHPDAWYTGLGSALLERVQEVSRDLRLWVFEKNTFARRFYAARGFVEVERTDGAGNQEREPDVLMRWVATDG